MAYPKQVSIVEVGPRDGFQSIKSWIPTDVKIQAIEMLLDAGVDLMEGCSFISPKAIPQMRDADEIASALLGRADREKVFALIANKKGADRAAESKMKGLTVVISASEAHNMSNVRKTPAESLAELRDIRQSYPEIHIKLALATAFGCPFLGEVPYESICFVIDGALALGVKDICLCDTIGVASPNQVRSLLSDLIRKYEDDGIDWSLHLHNTRGLAAANTLVALELGIDRFETAVAGLGGCPFAPGASGNMATEDLIYLLQELGIACNADIHKVIKVSEYLTQGIQCCGDSKINSVTVNKVFREKGV